MIINKMHSSKDILIFNEVLLSSNLKIKSIVV